MLWPSAVQIRLKFPNPNSARYRTNPDSREKRTMKMSKPLFASIVSLFLCSIALAAPPSQPQNVQQAWLGTESLLLWDEAANATSYNIYRSDNTNTTWTLVGSSSVPRFRDATYQFLPSFYVVTSVNADSESSG